MSHLLPKSDLVGNPRIITIGFPNEKITNIEEANTMIINVMPKSDNNTMSHMDIDLIMSQTNCTKEAAECALKESGGDIVNAIMAILDLQSKAGTLPSEYHDYENYDDQGHKKTRVVEEIL